MKRYPISMEIAGLSAMFHRPDVGFPVPSSYPAPTWSAVKGIFEAVYFSPITRVIPRRVEVCRPIRFRPYKTNSCLLEATAKDRENYQISALVLFDVRYKLYADVVEIVGKPKNGIHTTSAGHAHQERFLKHLRRGEHREVPCLGWGEFGPSYCGPLRDDTLPLPGVNEKILSMFKTPDWEGQKFPGKFLNNVEIRAGVLEFPND